MEVISLQKARGRRGISTAYRVQPWNEQPRPTTVVALLYEMLGVYSIILGDEGPQGGNQALSVLDDRQLWAQSGSSDLLDLVRLQGGSSLDARLGCG